jgi:hypothetical protein
MIFLYVYWHGDFDTMQFWFYKVVFFLVNKKYYILYQVNRLNLFIGFFWTSTIYCITSEKPKKHLWAYSRFKGMEIFFLLTFLPHWVIWDIRPSIKNSWFAMFLLQKCVFLESLKHFVDGLLYFLWFLLKFQIFLFTDIHCVPNMTHDKV